MTREDLIALLDEYPWTQDLPEEYKEAAATEILRLAQDKEFVLKTFLQSVERDEIPYYLQALDEISQKAGSDPCPVPSQPFSPDSATPESEVVDLYIDALGFRSQEEWLEQAKRAWNYHQASRPTSAAPQSEPVEKIATHSTQSPPTLKAHFQEWVNGSGVSEALTQLNVFDLDDPKEIAKLLNWKSYSGKPGWYVKSLDPATGQYSNFGQFKPDEPILFPDSDKPQKYFSFPKGAKSEAIFLAVDLETWELVGERFGVAITPADIDEKRVDLGFWRWVLGHPEISIELTEGAKKAACLLSHGWVAIALTGVWNGQRKKKLNPSLSPFIVPGRPVDLVFDADIIIKESVQEALKFQGHLIHRAKAIPRVVIWDLEQGKGCDDFIVTQGSKEFEQVMNNATTYSEWLKKLEEQFQGNQKQASRNRQHPTPPPEPVVLAAEIVERYRGRLAWNNEIVKWMRYEAETPGVWSEESNEAVEGMIQAELDTDLRCAGKYGYSLVSNIIKLMRGRLLVRHWDEQEGLLPLQDGVLDLASMQMLPHAPGFRLTWRLPYKWSARSVKCAPIQDWLLEAMKGDRSLVEVLRAYLKAIVTGRVDLQRYLECLGPGGTGKGTFMRLAEALVGHENVHATTLKQLEQNRFEAAAIYKKRLLLITDAERYGGEVSQLKAITGQDRIRYERKNVQPTGGFTPTCMVILAANEAVQSADYTSGLERRRLTMPWVHQVKPEDRRDLDAEFKPFLPGLLEWVLEMPDEQVTQLVRNTSSTVQSLARWKSEMLLETNPLADWLDFCIVHDLRPGIRTQVGVAKRDKSPDSPTAFLFVDCWLYPSYCEYSAAVGNKAVSQRRFSGLLHDLCVSQLKLEGVRKGRDERGAYFEGLVIRRDGDNRPRPISGGLTAETLAADESDANRVIPDAILTAETLAADESDGSDGFFKTQSRSRVIQEKNKPGEKGVSRILPGIENASLASVPSVARVSANSQPSVNRQEASEPNRLPLTQLQFKEGDRVRYVGVKYRQYAGLPLVIESIDAVWKVATCCKPDGRLTTGLPLQELKLLGEGCTNDA